MVLGREGRRADLSGIERYTVANYGQQELCGWVDNN